jgi:23S rRNA (guanosine2251-2'-O)-methyltransferase
VSARPTGRTPRRTSVRRPPLRARPTTARNREGLGGEQVEGRRAVYELLRARRRRVERVLVAEGQDPAEILDEIEREARRQRVSLLAVPMGRLEREARTEGHQGVVARAARVPTVTLAELVAVDDPFLLVCDGVTDPRNLGAMLRSAEGAGVTGVVLPRHRSARLTPAVTKTAAGAIEHLAFCDVPGVPSALADLARAGVLTVGLAGESCDSLYDLDLSNAPVALVVGGEERGLSTLTRKRCVKVVALPQRGALESLNASVAVAVAAYEVARQRESSR